MKQKPMEEKSKLTLISDPDAMKAKPTLDDLHGLFKFLNEMYSVRTDFDDIAEQLMSKDIHPDYKDMLKKYLRNGIKKCKLLTRIRIWHYKKGEYVTGPHRKLCGDMTGIEGDVTNIRGDLSGIRGELGRLQGDVSGITGDVSQLHGDVSALKGDMTGIRGCASNISGDIDKCWISAKDREKGIDIEDLVVETEEE